MARSVDVPGFDHGANPIPTASRSGPLLATGGVRGVDVASGRIAEGVEGQVRHALANLRTIIEAGGGTLADIVHVAVHAATAEVRPVLNKYWVELFPDPSARPARHLVTHDLPGEMVVQLEALAFITGESHA